jgi:DNA-binding beta-propeller fold protein YncE
MKVKHSVRLFFCGVLLTAVSAAGQVTASVPYTISTFATGVAGTYSQPDSIAVLGGYIYIGYGNGVAKDGTDGKSSTIVKYKANGDVVTTFSVVGHNDGLRVNPQTKKLWALQNEDGNPNLAILDPTTGAQTVYTFAPTAHGGGMTTLPSTGTTCFLAHPTPPIILTSRKPWCVRPSAGVWSV